MVVLLSPTTNGNYHIMQSISKIGEEELHENMENETIEEPEEYLEQIDASTSEYKVLQQSKRSNLTKNAL